MKNKKAEKSVIRGKEVAERDYRGLLAIVLIIGLILLLAKGDHRSASVLGPLAGSAVGWYFGNRRE